MAPDVTDNPTTDAVPGSASTAEAVPTARDRGRPLEGPWRVAAVWTAWTSGTVMVLVAAILVWNHARMRLDDPVDSPELAAMKARLREDPRNEALTAETRDLDYALITEYFRRQALAEKGMVVLLAAFVVWVVAVRAATEGRKESAVPIPRKDAAQAEARAAGQARWAVGGLAAVLAAGAIAWGLGCSIEPYDPTQKTVAGGPGDGGEAPAPEPKGPPPPSEAEVLANWGRFRGPRGQGRCLCEKVPTEWDGESGGNVLWKVIVPLPGQSSPVVWGDRVYLTGATEERREVYAFDAATGEMLWTMAVSTPMTNRPEPPKPDEGTGLAAPTPATDGRYVCAIFASGDVACFTPDGEEVWQRGFGVPENIYGYASSLLIHKNTLIIQNDQGTPDDNLSKLLALDLETGETVWEVTRPVAGSWSTPAVVETVAGTQLLTTANPWAIAYDPDSGEELWRAKVLGGDVASSPVASREMVFTVTVDTELCGIRPDGAGDVTESHVVWRAEGFWPDTTSPLTDGTRVWTLSTDGMWACYRAADGQQLYEQELEDMIFNGSPTLVGDRIYLLTTKGVMLQVGAGDTYEELGRAALGERSNCSPAMVDGRIYLRGVKHLYCIGEAAK